MGIKGIVLWLDGMSGRKRIRENEEEGKEEKIVMVGREGGRKWGFEEKIKDDLREEGKRVNVGKMY